MTDPIVALIATCKEGQLVQGAIRSALACCSEVFVYEGLTEPAEVSGDDTDVGKWYPFVNWYEDEWAAESAKRSEMLAAAKLHMQGDFWILTLDADELLVWGENLPDWTGQLNPGYFGKGKGTGTTGENVVPLLRTEARWDSGLVYADVAPSRLVHSSLVDRYLVSCWQAVTPDQQTVVFDHYKSERQPFPGEPHIHHRAYLRRGERKLQRLSKGEEQRWLDERGLRRIGE